MLLLPSPPWQYCYCYYGLTGGLQYEQTDLICNAIEFMIAKHRTLFAHIHDEGNRHTNGDILSHSPQLQTKGKRGLEFDTCSCLGHDMCMLKSLLSCLVHSSLRHALSCLHLNYPSCLYSSSPFCSIRTRARFVHILSFLGTSQLRNHPFRRPKRYVEKNSVQSS